MGFPEMSPSADIVNCGDKNKHSSCQSSMDLHVKAVKRSSAALSENTQEVYLEPPEHSPSRGGLWQGV